MHKKLDRIGIITIFRLSKILDISRNKITTSNKENIQNKYTKKTLHYITVIKYELHFIVREIETLSTRRNLTFCMNIQIRIL